MKSLNLSFVLKQLPSALLYLLLGLFLGALSSYLLFNFNKNFLEFILTVWFKRILLGIDLFGEYSAFWFIFNNTLAILIVIFASWFILTHVSKTPEFLITKKFRLKKHRPKIILAGLYMIPLGALLINGFLVSLFITYVLLSFGFDAFVRVIYLLLPHGITESFALLLASSLGLAYLKILSPYILKGRWKLCSRKLKKLLVSKCSLFVIGLIIILVIFSGFLEGILSFLIKL